MTLEKQAQFVSDLDGVHLSEAELDELFPSHDSADLQVELEISPENEAELNMLQSEPNISGEVVVETSEGDEIKQDFDFTLPAVPGGESQEDIVPDLEVEEESDVIVENDPWKWTIKQFLPWLQDKMKSIPKHTGFETSGVERALSYLYALDKEISKAVRQDINNEIAVEHVEKARDEIYNGISRLEDRLEKLQSKKHPNKRKKRAEEAEELIKNAMKSARFEVNVPIFISFIARVIINSSVSAGKDAEDIFNKLVERYKLDKREQVSVLQVLQDMGFNFWNRELYDPDFDPTNPENLDLQVNYQA